MNTTQKLTLFVDNRVGVLDQISILVRRSGWNIKSIHACEEPWNQGTRVILTMEGRAELRLLLEQLGRLDCIRDLRVGQDGPGRELALVKGDPEALKETALHYGAALLEDGATYQFCGTEEAVDGFLTACARETRIASMRTGPIRL